MPQLYPLRLLALALLTTTAPSQVNVSTFSGGGPILAGATDGTGSAALFNAPTGVALHADGTLLYVADRGNNKVRAIRVASGEVWTLAGGGATGTIAGSALANGIGTAALFKAPWNLAFSPAYNLILVADSDNHAVRAITQNGLVSTLAGGGATGVASGTTDGTGTSALFNTPVALAVEPDSGVAYVLERARLRGLRPDGSTWFIAGGAGGFNDGEGSNAGFSSCCNAPMVCGSMILGEDGFLYLLGAYYGQFRRVDVATSTVTSFYNYPSMCCIGQGSGLALSPGAAGSFYIMDSYANRILTLPYASLAVNAPNRPFTGMSGSGDGDPYVAGLSLPGGAALSADASALFIADTYNNRIRAVDTVYGVLSTLAGGGNAQTTGAGPGTNDGGPRDALFYSPWGLAAVSNTSLILTDAATHQVRHIDACNGTVTVAGTRPTGYVGGSAVWNSRGFADSAAGTSAKFNSPRHIGVLPSGSYVIADRDNHRLRAVTPGGAVTTLAGSGAQGLSNGTALTALLNLPDGVAVSVSGTVYFSESGNHAVRLVTPLGVVAPLAGPRQGAVAAGAVDATGADARFNGPQGLAVFEPTGDVYVGDWGNRKVRRIAPSGAVTTLCGGGGTGVQSGNFNGIGTSALMGGPTALAFLGSTLYIADNMNHNIRVVADVTAWPAAAVGTLAGAGAGLADGTMARFNSPSGLAVAGTTLWISDSLNHRIRRVELRDGAAPCFPSASASHTVTVSATRTPSASRSTSRTASVSPTRSRTPSSGAPPSGTDTGSRSGSPSPTQTPSVTPTAARTWTPTVSPTSSASRLSPSRTSSPSPTGACPASYFCSSGAPVICPVGSACPLGSFSPVLCAAGTFSSAPGAANCTQCAPGSHAPSPGATACAPCPGGHYCPVGTGSTARLACGRGSFCPPASAAPRPCPLQVPPAGGWGAQGVQGPAFLVETAGCANHCFWNLSADGLLSRC